MELSTRVFGFSGFAMLAPIALCGVAAVGVLYSAVRRTFGHAAASVAALVAALTPITVAINRDDNPDPVLVLLMTLAAWFTLEALRTKRLRHLLWAAVMIGCAFNTKMLQAYIVLPALVVVYLFAAEGGFWRRIRHLSLFTAVLAAASFWWMLIVDAIPASSRPYIGGSTTNSVWDLVIGYNGLGRITGNETGNGGGGANFSGTSGFGRLFNDILGTQISWLLPAAAILCVTAVALRGRAPRTDPVRASLLLWGLWLGVHFIVFSFQQGTMHPYYVTTMGPAIGALVGGGGSVLWRQAHEAGAGRSWARVVLPTAVCISGLWAIVLLHRSSYATWLVPVIAMATIVAMVALVAMHVQQPQYRARLGAVGLGALLIAGLAGPGAFAASTAGSTVNGTNPLAGPSNGSMGGPGGGFGGARGEFGGAPGQTGQTGQSGQLPSFGDGQGGPGGSGGGFGGGGGQSQQQPSFGDGQPGLGELGSGGGGSGLGSGGFGGGAGAGADAGVSSAMLSYLEQNQGSAKWLVATSSSNSAASIELQTGKAAISMWGFTGSDPAMTV
jgi:4-amino-4-deoxy-L-arabinose transferase-like glycosyltransferase